jgi:hypothetical protein
MHEELVRRPISNAIEVLGTPRGELTVVLFLGDKTNINRSGPPDDARIADEYAELMERGTVMRREALRELAGRYHLTQRQVYSALERFKKCVE